MYGCNVSVPDNTSDIPEWKKVLIMKKRGTCEAQDTVNRNSLCENSKSKEQDTHKSVKIGSINVELRSVKPHEIPNSLSEERNNNCQFDEADPCLEDLRYGPGIVDRLRARFLNIGVKQQVKPVVRRFSSLENLPGIPYRVNTKGIRQNGFKSVKKAQSMETLSCTNSEQHVISSRPNARIVVGAKARILSKNVSQTDAPRLFNKRRWERSVQNINEDELPKPDTVKHVKKIFESPSSAKTVSNPRFRKISSTTTSHVVCNNSAIVGSRSAVKKIVEDAKATCAKENCNVNKAPVSEKYDAINEISDNDLSVNLSCEARIAQETSDLLEDSSDLDSPNKVTPEPLPLELSHKQSDPLSQEVTRIVSPSDQTAMVVAGEDPQKTSWQKSTSIVFDFRGRKDVEPHIALNPAPFGCRPAKISRNSSSKRTGSPPRPPANGFLPDHLSNDEEDEDDIGAHLPLISGIVFEGENVKVGRGSFLETRNKKLNIQFDDKATSTFEYPPENTSFSPSDENDPFDSSTAMGSAANSRLALSNYTPQVLSANDEFELGVSHLKHRPTSTVRSSESDEIKESITDVLIPADPGDTVGWSAAETADILF